MDAGGGSIVNIMSIANSLAQRCRAVGCALTELGMGQRYPVRDGRRWGLRLEREGGQKHYRCRQQQCSEAGEGRFHNVSSVSECLLTG
jgi:hypothetical protein